MAALLFDLDGTIADSAAGILACARDALQEFGVTPPDDLRWAIGPPLEASLERLLGGPEHVEACARAYRRRYAETGVHAAEPFDGVVGALRRLRDEGHHLFVCTSKLTGFAGQIVGRFGLADAFAGVYGAEPGGHDKAVLAARILAEHRLDLGSACLIGDRREDVHAGRRNGLATVGVLWGYGSREELTEAGADRLCSAPDRLGEALSGLVT